MTTTALQFRTYSGKRRADGETYSYVIARQTSGRGWRVVVYRQNTLAGMTVLGERYEEEYTETMTLGIAVARAYEANVDADTKPSQNRMTRAIGRAYDEEN